VTETAQVLRPLGLTLSKEKTRITHIKDGIDFLGWRIKRDLGRRGRPGIFLTPWQAGWIAEREPTVGLERLQGLIAR